MTQIRFKLAQKLTKAEKVALEGKTGFVVVATGDRDSTVKRFDVRL
ncbi:hypothetical protein QUA13_26350 [Microcoleus sp. S28C3]